MTRQVQFFIVLIISFNIASVSAGSYRDISERYPPDAYIVGMGEVEPSGDEYKDRSRAGTLARVDIAKQIRVRIREASIDVMCEGKGKEIFAGFPECRNRVITIVETLVDEFLEGSRIVEAGEDKDRGIYYAVAVLPKKKAALQAREKFEESIGRVRESIDQAKSSSDELTKRRHIEDAMEALMRGVAYEEERSALNDIQEGAEGLFKELAREIRMIEKTVNIGQ